LGFSKSSARTVLLDLEVASRIATGGPLSHELLGGAPLSDGDRESLLVNIERARTQKAPLRSFSVPETLHIELTRFCPFECPSCYLDKGAGESLSWTKLEAVLLEAVHTGVLQVAFGGGEPSLFPQLEDAVGLVGSYGLGVSITTGGFGVGLGRLARLRSVGLDHLQVSMPLEPSSHDSRIASSAWGALDAARRLGLSTGTNVIVTRSVVERLSAHVAELAERGVQRINLLRPKPEALDTGWFQASRLRGEDWAALARELWKIKTTRPHLKVTLDSAMSPVMASSCGRLGARPAAGCAAGRRFLVVDVSGRLKPCSHVGESEEMGLMQYWWSSQALCQLRRLEETLSSHCARCEHLGSCRGCRAVAGTSAPDPDCPRA
jgi:pyrroloquinoline quinone biosynthesis protein E